MLDIKFGTDGWRAIIAEDFTVANVMRIAAGTGIWMKKHAFSKIVIGHDTRFAGELFARTAARIIADMDIQVLYADRMVTTPMVSLATKELGADLGIVITASHNPPSYNGYKLKSRHGGPALADDLKGVEAEIPMNVPAEPRDFTSLLSLGKIKYADLDSIYYKQIDNYFDLKLLEDTGKKMAYDSMFGAGQEFMKSLFPDAYHLHDEVNPGFNGQAPEPIAKNLKELSQIVKHNSSIELGFANDGDADRIGFFDEKGSFIDAHHIMLLVLYYLVEHKGQRGKVVISMASSEKIKKLCRIYGLEYEYTSIGFKNIAPVMLKEKVLLGGEEAGGVSSIGHIPERDGIWIGLLLMEMIAVTGKKLSELIATVYEKVGPFSYDRYDLSLSEEKKKEITGLCERGELKEIAGRRIEKIYDLDGYKYYFKDDEWLMIRASGTEPVLRLYAQSKTREEVVKLLDEAREFLLK